MGFLCSKPVHLLNIAHIVIYFPPRILIAKQMFSLLNNINEI